MLFVLRHSHRSRPFLLDMFVPAFVFPTAADGAEAEFPFFNLLHRRERKNLCSHNWSMDSSFCIFFTWAKIEFFAIWVPPCEENGKCPERSSLFGSGFPIGVSSTLLAHDFALQSLVCYTFCDRWRWKGGVALQNTPFPVAAGQADFGTVCAEMQDLSV